MRTTTRTITTLAGVLLAAVATTATATAATAAPAPAHHFGVTARGTVALDDNASSVAGYGADLSHFTNPPQWKASATFTVPNIVCTPKVTNVLFVQLFFSGTDKAGNGLGEGGYAIAGCDGGTTPFFSLNVSAQGGTQGGANIGAAAGDVVTVSFVATRKSEVSTINDVTSGTTASQIGTGFGAVGNMQVSVQGGDAHSVFPRFNRVHFTKVTGAGQPLQALNPGSFDAVDSAGNIKIHPEGFDGTGRNFFVDYVGNFSPGA